MKKRRTLIISLLLVAALCLGIGYASVTDILDISGIVEANGSGMAEDFDGDVYFSAISGNTGKASESRLIGDKSDNASFHVDGLSALDETVSVTYTIQNDYSSSVWVSLITPSNDSNDYLEITHDLTLYEEIPAGGSIDVTVTARVKHTTSADTSLNYALQISIVNEDPNVNP